MNGAAQAIGTLADGGMLLCGLALTVWPGLRAARRVLFAEIALVGVGGVAAAGGDGRGVAVAIAVAGLSVACVAGLFRPPRAEPVEAGAGWLRLEAPPAAATGAAWEEVGGDRGVWPALGFLLLLVLAVLAVARLPGSAMGSGRGTLAIGLAVAIGGAAGSARAAGPGLGQAAGAVTALQALGWTVLRLWPVDAPGWWAGLTGAPAAVLLAALLAMRAMSAALRDWMLNEAGHRR